MDDAALDGLTRRALDGCPPDAEEALALAGVEDAAALMARAARVRDHGHGDLVTYSPKVFVPLTRLCRDVCSYCTFAAPPRRGESAYLTPERVLEIARAGQRAGCREALFTLGDRPERRYRAAREALAALGHETTLSYLAEAAGLVLRETGLLPHLNAGVMSAAEVMRLRGVSVSQGIMLESASDRLCERGGPHFGSPDKRPAVRLATIAAAGHAAVPFTSGILIGIGETRRERVEALLALRALYRAHGHLQEVIVQNFRPKPGTRMAGRAAPSHADHLWTIAVARLVLGPAMSIQAPPNLAGGALADLIAAGIDDWGGVSPVTPDHVNPEAPWPEIAHLARATAAAGKTLAPRLAVYPGYVHDRERWLDPAVHRAVLAAADAEGLARADDWVPGTRVAIPQPRPAEPVAPAVRPERFVALLDRAAAGRAATESDIVALFAARGERADAVVALADGLRREIAGDRISYVVNRNINYTNICGYRCRFCAFSKGRTSESLRGRPYDLPLEEIQRRAVEAWARGATEVCLQGGIHPAYDGHTYRAICAAVKSVTPAMHVHAFSPLEITHGASTLGMTIRDFLLSLADAGLGSLPGTAAEILDDEVRAVICPDKISTAEWLGVVRTAHEIGLRTTSTIMFGHVDHPRHWARHLLRILALQEETGGFTEFVPLPFVPMETPIFIHGRARRGATFREALLMHAVSRIVFQHALPNIQTSWVKMGPEGARACLEAGANDFGGILMDESITRAAGAEHGQEMPSSAMIDTILALGRRPWLRTTLYEDASPDRAASAGTVSPPSREAR